MMDKRLLILEKHIETNGEMLDNLAEILDVSERQLSRIMKKWTSEGYIRYTPGKGRGYKSKVALKVDAEKELFSELMQTRHDLSLDELSKYLMLPWHKETLKLIVRIMSADYELPGEVKDVAMMDYIYRIPSELHPAYTTDYAAFKVLFNTMDRLYDCDRNGIITYNLVKYDEFNGDTLKIYLKKDIYFHDGSEMTAIDVKHSLEMMKVEGVYTEAAKVMGEITVHSDHYLSVEALGNHLFLKYFLSGPFSSICKIDEDGRLMGTGPYFVYNTTSEDMILKASRHYEPKAEVGEIQLLVNRKKLHSLYSSHPESQKLQLRHQGYITFMFNPVSDRLTYVQREWLKSVILNVLYEAEAHDYTVEPLFDVTEAGEPPDFQFPIYFLSHEYSREKINLVTSALSQIGIATETVHYNAEEFFRMNLMDIKADIGLFMATVKDKHPFNILDMLTYTKFREWYGRLPMIKEFTDASMHLHDEKLKSMSQKIMDYLLDEVYIIPVSSQIRHLLLPEGFKNIEVSGHNTIKYNKIIVTDR